MSRAKQELLLNQETRSTIGVRIVILDAPSQALPETDDSQSESNPLLAMSDQTAKPVKADSNQAESVSKGRNRGVRGAVVLAILIGIGIGVVAWKWPNQEPNQTAVENLNSVKVGVPQDGMSAEDRALANKIIGTWYQEEYGKKTLTIMPGGKAKMLMEPNAIFAMVYGDRIDCDMKWTIKDGFIDYGITGGTPADKIEKAKKAFGGFWHEKIKHLDDDALILIEEDDDLSEWKKIPADITEDIGTSKDADNASGDVAIGEKNNTNDS